MYLVFAYYTHYPKGGAEDLQMVTDSVEEAVQRCRALTAIDDFKCRSEYNHAHVLEVLDESTEIIFRS